MSEDAVTPVLLDLDLGQDPQLLRIGEVIPHTPLPGHAPVALRRGLTLVLAGRLCSLGTAQEGSAFSAAAGQDVSGLVPLTYAGRTLAGVIGDV